MPSVAPNDRHNRSTRARGGARPRPPRRRNLLSSTITVLLLVVLVVALMGSRRARRTPAPRRGSALHPAIRAPTAGRRRGPKARAHRRVLVAACVVALAALVPLGLAVLTAPTSWRRRAGTACIALLVSVLPTAAWYLLAPIMAVAIASGAHRSGAESRARRAASYGTSQGLGPWLWFIAAYTGLVLVQRWGINREVIARYWLPYWTVTVVVAGRCVDDVVAGAPRTRRLAIVVLCPLLLVFASYNVAQSAVRARENALDGITLNAVRYQESAVLGSLADGDVDHVHTDDTYLVEFQTYARGAVIPVDRMSCRVETVDALVAQLAEEQAAGGTPAVAIVGRCRAGDFTDALVAALDGAAVQHEPGTGTVVVPAG